MKIVFMGTPDFAVGTLDALIAEGYDIAAVFTQPDKPQGRKLVMTPPPVKVRAEQAGIPVFQPRTLRDGEAKEILKKIEPDLAVVVAYGKILPPDILSLPKKGCMNVHASLLPKYRGASPIQWSIVCGEKRTGVTTMYMDEGMDTGDILETAEVDILPEDNAATLTEKLSALGASLAVSTVKKIENGTAVRHKQDDAAATRAPIIKKDDARLDFAHPAEELNNLIRGLIVWPTAFFESEGSRIKVYSARAIGSEELESICCRDLNTEDTNGMSGTDGRGGTNGTASSVRVGEVICSTKRLIVGCGNNTALEILEVKPEGKAKMTAAAFLSGRKLPEGSILR